MESTYETISHWDINGGRLRWHGHSTVSLALPGYRIYIDPYRLHGTWPDANLILITHPHYDHLDPESLGKIANGSTRIVTPTGVQLPDGCPHREHIRLTPGQSSTKPGQSLDYDLRVETTPAYTPDRRFHPEKNQWNSYVIEVSGQRIFHAGDTGPHDDFPQNIDLALVPVDGIYTMNSNQAATWANRAGFRSVAPIHYDTIRGSISDAVNFCRRFTGGRSVRFEPTTL